MSLADIKVLLRSYSVKYRRMLMLMRMGTLQTKMGEAQQMKT